MKNNSILTIARCMAVVIWMPHVGLAFSATDGDKPSIVFILADDLGFNQLGCYGDTPVQTPNLDGLARSGIRFTQAYAGNTVCSPSRVSLFTGRDGRLMENNSNTVQLRDIDVTMAHVLKHANYDTALFGKYSIGSQMGVTDPLAMGFDHWYGMYSKDTASIRKSCGVTEKSCGSKQMKATRKEPIHKSCSLRKPSPTSV